jgi:hypothetical protein
VVEWLKIKSFSEDENFIISILYGFVGVATNLAVGSVYGKPYFPFYVSAVARGLQLFWVPLHWIYGSGLRSSARFSFRL